MKIPPGTGKKLRLTGKGSPGPMGGPPGDLYVKLKELEHPVFKREGNDLLVDRRIKLSEATLGTKVTVPTLDGKTMSLKVPPGTQSQTKMRLKNYGLPTASGKSRGDQLVRIIVETPANLTKKQKALLEELAKEGIEAEVIDLATIRPLDWFTILESVKKTNRLVIVEEQWPFASVSSEITYRIQKEGFDYLFCHLRL